MWKFGDTVQCTVVACKKHRDFSAVRSFQKEEADTENWFNSTANLNVSYFAGTVVMKLKPKTYMLYGKLKRLVHLVKFWTLGRTSVVCSEGHPKCRPILKFDVVPD